MFLEFVLHPFPRYWEHNFGWGEREAAEMFARFQKKDVWIDLSDYNLCVIYVCCALKLQNLCSLPLPNIWKTIRGGGGGVAKLSFSPLKKVLVF